MSMDPSLKSGASLKRHRNVLTRTERIERLMSREKFDLESGDPLGLPKVGNRKLISAGKKKKAAGDDEE